MIHRNTPLIDRLITYLHQRGGRAGVEDICREVLGLANCTSALAHTILRSGLPQDYRYILQDGAIALRSNGNGDIPVDGLSYAVIDIEATSLPGASNRIMEFAAVLVDGGSLGPRLTTLVNPTVKIPPYVRDMTGITDEAVATAPLFEEVADRIVDFIGDRVIVAHNSQFDVGILNAELQRARGITLGNPSLCTVRLARKLQPGLEKYQLGAVAKFFNIDMVERHRAEADAEAAAKILLHLLDIAAEKGWHQWSQLDKAAGARTDVETPPEN